ncbi:porin [Pseudoduganella violacea]|uniref:Putative porin n=1 Tax=Pseudoduganella violacea TaxID=1715466 RepID=A0A7W5FWD3_9BURK|nr:porin [Pseudoduganella violacea]MBB3121895.1 putative porin [Pseudoduganella violacea]
MKKSLLALAMMGAFSGAYAQSSVTIYGTVDAGLLKQTGTTTQVSKRDNNKLGFRGVEDLGSGLKALFQLEIRYESDTGTIENTSGANSRPLFQGQSRVGLQGDFGTIRFGRGLTAYQETSTGYEPWSGMPTPAGFQTDLHVAGYTSDPLSQVGNSRNRFSNAVFYNTPVYNGFQLNVTVAAKEANNSPAIIGRGTALAPQYPANAVPSANPYSVSATYTAPSFSLMAGGERNAVETKLWSVAAWVKPIADLKLMASYQHQDEGHTKAVNDTTKAWVVGANYTVGMGKILAGYGRKEPDGLPKTKQFSLGYEHNLSARTYLYIDASNKKAATKVNTFSLGVHHNF